MKKSGPTKIFGILGHPISHTLSPPMQNTAFEALGCNALYVPFDVHPRSLRRALAGLEALGCNGLNVTIPHKQTVLKYLDELTEEARLIGAVNTIEIRGIRWVGHNTDGRGFVQAFQSEIGKSFHQKRVLIVGAGGAARAVATQLLIEGTKFLVISNRTRAKANALIRALKKNFPNARLMSIPLEKKALLEVGSVVDVIINATSVGMKRGDRPPIPLQMIMPAHIVCDLVYQRSDTALTRQSRKVGARVMNGIGMLLYQGGLAFEIWTGRKAPLGKMKKALIKALKAR